MMMRQPRARVHRTEAERAITARSFDVLAPDLPHFNAKG
jgi:hypothetical protein